MISRQSINDCYLGELKKDSLEKAWEIKNPRAEYYSHTKDEELIATVDTPFKPHYLINNFELIYVLEKFAFLNEISLKWYKRVKKS